MYYRPKYYMYHTVTWHYEYHENFTVSNFNEGFEHFKRLKLIYVHDVDAYGYSSRWLLMKGYIYLYINASLSLIHNDLYL